jgi:hypothetical protein
VEFSSGSILKFERQSIGSFEGIQPWGLQGVGRKLRRGRPEGFEGIGREASKESVGGAGGERFAVLAAGYVGTRRGKVSVPMIRARVGFFASKTSASSPAWLEMRA